MRSDSGILDAPVGVVAVHTNNGEAGARRESDELVDAERVPVEGGLRCGAAVGAEPRGADEAAL